MSDRRQNNQLELALVAEGKGEAPRVADRGTAPPIPINRAGAGPRLTGVARKHLHFFRPLGGLSFQTTHGLYPDPNDVAAVRRARGPES